VREERVEEQRESASLTLIYIFIHIERVKKGYIYNSRIGENKSIDLEINKALTLFPTLIYHVLHEESPNYHSRFFH